MESCEIFSSNNAEVYIVPYSPTRARGGGNDFKAFGKGFQKEEKGKVRKKGKREGIKGRFFKRAKRGREEIKVRREGKR